MNVEFPFDTSQAGAFWAIVAVSAIAAFSISYYFIKKR
jgi:Mg2+ and Co2+ transporter CorA